MGRFSGILQKLEVNHEPGLTQTQMFLSVSRCLVLLLTACLLGQIRF